MSDDIKINPSEFQAAIEGALREYGDVVYKATEEGLDAAENVLIKKLKAATPRKTGEFSKSWKGTKRKYNLMRFVGNTKKVSGAKGDISLADIFEYSTTKGRPFIKSTYEKSTNEMVAAMVATLKKEI